MYINAEHSFLPDVLKCLRDCGTEVLEEVLTMREDTDIGMNCLQIACSYYGDSNVINDILDCLNDCKPEIIKDILAAEDEKGWSSLHYVCQNCSSKTVKATLDLLKGCGGNAIEEVAMAEDSDGVAFLLQVALLNSEAEEVHKILADGLPRNVYNQLR